MSRDVPPPKLQARRRQAPKHITLPATLLTKGASNSEEVPFSHIYPSPLATRSSVSSGERDRIIDPFLILSNDTPPTPARPSIRTPALTPAVRRPVLPAAISLKHALGDTRAPSLQDPGHLTRDQRAPSKAKKDSATLSPIKLNNLPRSPLTPGTQLQPESAPTSPKRKSRPRSRTAVSERGIAGARWSLDTPSFRSAAYDTPTSTGPPTPRNISISEIPMLNDPLGCPVDVFGLAALQPPRLIGRPRPKAQHRASAGTPTCEPADGSQPTIGTQHDLTYPARTASPVNG